MLTTKKQGRNRLFKQSVFAARRKTVQRRSSAARTGHSLWASVLLWTSFALVSGYVLLFSPFLMISEVTVEGGVIIASDEYRSLVEEQLRGNFLGMMQHRNFFLVSTSGIEHALLEQYPVLMRVDVRRQFPNRILVRIEETTALLRWCSGGPCYGIRDGRAIATPLADDVRYVAVRLSLIDESALPVMIGEMLPVEQYMETLRAVHELLPLMIPGDGPVVATTPSRHSGEIAVFTNEQWRLLLSVERPSAESLGVLRAFLEEYTESGGDRTRLASVDLRVEGRIFYTEKNAASETLVPVGTESNTAESSRINSQPKKKANR